MRKLSALILTFVIVLTLSACNMTGGGNGGVNSSLINDSSETSTPAVSNTVSSTTPLSQVNPKISKDEAVNTALKKAGLKKENVRELESELDYKNGVLVYEIEFKSGNKEYSFDIGANDGKIIYEKTETDD